MRQQRAVAIHFQGERMANSDSIVTIHMVASLDGFVARKDGSVEWLETSDQFDDGETLDPGFIEAFLDTIDCYVMGSRTYETALGFEAKGLGWVYGDKPTFVLTRRELPRPRSSIELWSGGLEPLVDHLSSRSSASACGPYSGASGLRAAVRSPRNACASGSPTRFVIRCCRS